MKQWWYVIDGQRKGPVDDADLPQLVQQGAIGPSTLLWATGMAQWLAMHDIAELKDKILLPPPLPTRDQSVPVPTIPPPAVPSSEQRETVLAKEPPITVLARDPKSTAWQRYLAKSLDIVIAVILVVIAEIGLAFASPAFQIWLQNPDNNFILMVVALGLTPFVEALLSVVFGNSPGKALLGVSVRDIQGQRLSFGSHVARNLRVAWFGLGAFIPFVTLFTMIYQYRALKDHGKTPYDIGRYAILARRVSSPRYMAAVVIIAATLVAGQTLDVQDRIERQNFSLGQRWTNPFNYSTVDVPSGWLVSSQINNIGDTIYVFTRPHEEMQAIFGRETLNPGMTLTSYVYAFAQAVQKDMLLFTPGQPDTVGLYSAWTIRGHMATDASQKITVTFIADASAVWRVVGVRLRSANPETAAYLKLRERLLFSAAGGR